MYTISSAAINRESFHFLSHIGHNIFHTDTVETSSNITFNN